MQIENFNLYCKCIFCHTKDSNFMLNLKINIIFSINLNLKSNQI